MTIDYVFRKITGQPIDHWAGQGKLSWYSHYADERQDSGKGVLTANWNHFPRPEAAESHRTDEGKAAQDFNWGKGRKFQDILERMGYHLEWSDQTDRCEHCQGCICTGKDYYGDTAHYGEIGSDTICEKCLRRDFASEYLESLEDNPRAAVHIQGIDPEEHGYERIEGDYESGFHPGQTDNPVEIYRRLEQAGIGRVLFVIDDCGQFDTRFSVWRKKEEKE